MITYKGDRFVKGKKFVYESNEVTFVTKSKKGYIFESSNSDKNLILDESVAKSLKEVSRCKKAV